MNHEDQPKRKFPSLFQMMKSFTKDLGKYIRDGGPNVTPDEYADRLDVCNTCEFFDKNAYRCTECGCMMQHKAKWATAVCPKNKWAILPAMSTKEIMQRNIKIAKENNIEIDEEDIAKYNDKDGGKK